MRKLNLLNLNIESYKKIWDLQKSIFTARLEGRIDDTLILLEHNPVYTLGKSSDKNHLLMNRETLEKNKIELFEIDRGGDITFHGIGQLVGYPIIKLDDLYLDLHRYLRDLEEVIIKTISKWKIIGIRDEDYTGVWVKKNKIAAIGVKISRWITMHGFALNVNTDLKYFDNIIPCGIFHKGVTSIKNEIGSDILMNDVKMSVIENFKLIFNYDCFENYDSVDSFLKINKPIQKDGRK